MSSFATGTGDATAARVRTELKIFTDWLTANNQQGKGMIGEYGWPGSSQALTDPNNAAIFDPAWDAVAQQWYIDANAANLMLTNWLACEWNVDLRSYETDDGTNKQFNYRTTVSSVLEANYNQGGSGVLRGVNIAGGDFSDYGPNGVVNISTTVQPGAGYFYTLDINIQLLALRGCTFLRIPLRWERLQRTLLGGLSQPDMAQLLRMLATCAKYGIVAMPDIHNYGRYDTVGNGQNSNGVYDLGQNAPATHNGQNVGGTMMNCYQDFITKLSNALKGQPGFWGLDIMNEPHDFNGGNATHVTMCQTAVEAIRAVDQNCFIAVPGYTYDTVPGWTSSNGNTAWLTETIPAGQTGAGQARNTDPKIRWQGHHYFDYAHSGTYGNTYASELSQSQSAGYTSYTNSGYVAPTTGNTQQTGPRTQFTHSMDGTYNWDITTGFTAQSAANGDSYVLPYAADGNPGNSFKVTCGASSDEYALRKSLTAAMGKNIRSAGFDFKLPTGSTVATNSNFAVFHAWDNTYTNNIIEIRVVGAAGGYTVGLTIPTGGYTFVQATTPTVLPLGAWNNLRVAVTDTGFSLFVNNSPTPEVTISASNSGVNIGGFALGKFYGTYVGDMLFDNFVGTINATYYAPAGGGLLAQINNTVVSTFKPILGFI